MKEKINTRDPIKQKLDRMWTQDNKKPFVVHLMYSYLPLPKATKLSSWNESPNNKSHKCALTNMELVSLDEVIGDLMTPESQDMLFKYLGNQFSEKIENIPHPFADKYKTKKLAYKGENTDTVMSLDALLNFQDWVFEKIVQGDRDVSNSINKIQSLWINGGDNSE